MLQNFGFSLDYGVKLSCTGGGRKQFPFSEIGSDREL